MTARTAKVLSRILSKNPRRWKENLTQISSDCQPRSNVLFSLPAVGYNLSLEEGATREVYINTICLVLDSLREL